MRVRLAGIIPMENGFALMHRTEVKNRNYSDYFVFPGGGQEGEETLEEGTIREIKEEFGIDVKVIKQLYFIKNELAGKECEEYFFLCEQIGGIFGTGDGPEFSGDSKYIDSGKYFPTIVPVTELENTFILPPEVKSKLIEDIKDGKFNKYFNNI